MKITHPTFSLQLLINYINNQPDLFKNISDFHFAIPLADKVRKRGCQCGLGGEFAAVSNTFNEVVQNLKPETIETLKKNLNTDQICFGIQTKFAYELKCY